MATDSDNILLIKATHILFAPVQAVRSQAAGRRATDASSRVGGSNKLMRYKPCLQDADCNADLKNRLLLDNQL